MVDKKTRTPSKQEKSSKPTELPPPMPAPPAVAPIEDAIDLDDINDVTEVALAGDEVGDPDIGVLTQQEDENLEDESLEVDNPRVASELSDDPVRLYLREIGEVKLLDSDSEFRLATIIESYRLVNTLRHRPLRKGLSVACSIYHALIVEMLTSWERLIEDVTNLRVQPPDLSQMLTEAQALHSGWQLYTPSYLRAYLDNG